MLKSACLAVILTLGMCWGALASAVEENKTHILCYDYSGDIEHSVVLIYLTPDAIEELWESQGVVTVKDMLQDKPNGGFYVTVIATQDCRFLPTEIRFIQGNSTFQVAYGDYYPISGNFDGMVPAGTSAKGIVFAPESLDIARPTTVIYRSSENKEPLVIRADSGDDESVAERVQKLEAERERLVVRLRIVEDAIDSLRTLTEN